MRRTFLLIFALFCLSHLFAQTPDFNLPSKSDLHVKPSEFDYALLEEIILVKINEARYNKSLDLLKEKIELKKTAYDQASFYAYAGKVEKSDPGERAILYGGTRNVSEITGYCSIKSGADFKTYRKVANELVDKWNQQVNIAEELYGDFYLFIGVATAVNAESNRIFASLILGNTNSFAIELDETALQYISEKTFKVENYEPKACRKCPGFESLYQFYDGLKVDDDGNIIFHTDNAKEFKRYIKGEDDGLIIDIVQSAQYPCGQNNIIDYKNSNKGIVLKPVFGPEILKKNTSDERNMLTVKLGELPKEITDDYELNMIVINENHFCTAITKTEVAIPQITDRLTFDFYTYKDPKFVNENVMSFKDIPEKMDRDFCWRSESKYYENEFNTYDCVLMKLRHDKMKDFNDVLKTNTQLDILYNKEKINTDTLKLLDIAIQGKIITSNTFEQDLKDQSYERLKQIELPKLSKENNLALANIYIERKDYLKAIELLDNIVFENDAPEDLLFAYISLCTLYKERINSGTFAKALKKAAEVNKSRYCLLFKVGKFSFQLFENAKVKDLYCKTCK